MSSRPASIARPAFGDTAASLFIAPKMNRAEREIVRAKLAESIGTLRSHDDEVREAYRLREVSALEIMALLSHEDADVRRLAQGQWRNRFSLEERDAARATLDA